MVTLITDIVLSITLLVIWFAMEKEDYTQVKPLIPISFSKLPTLDRKSERL